MDEGVKQGSGTDSIGAPPSSSGRPYKVEPMSQELIVSSSLMKPSHKYFALTQGSIYLTSQNAIAFEIQGKPRF